VSNISQAIDENEQNLPLNLIMYGRVLKGECSPVLMKKKNTVFTVSIRSPPKFYFLLPYYSPQKNSMKNQLHACEKAISLEEVVTR